MDEFDLVHDRREEIEEGEEADQKEEGPEHSLCPAHVILHKSVVRIRFLTKFRIQGCVPRTKGDF